MKVRRKLASTRAVAPFQNRTGDHPRVPSLTGRSPHKAPGRTESLTYQCCRWAAVLRGNCYNQPPAGRRALRQGGKQTAQKQQEEFWKAARPCVELLRSTEPAKAQALAEVMLEERVLVPAKREYVFPFPFPPLFILARSLLDFFVLFRVESAWMLASGRALVHLLMSTNGSKASQNREHGNTTTCNLIAVCVITR